MKRSVWLPALLLIYLAVMAVLGIQKIDTGEMNILTYLLLVIITLGCIWLLRRNLISRENKKKQN